MRQDASAAPAAQFTVGIRKTRQASPGATIRARAGSASFKMRQNASTAPAAPFTVGTHTTQLKQARTYPPVCFSKLCACQTPISTSGGDTGPRSAEERFGKPSYSENAGFHAEPGVFVVSGAGRRPACQITGGRRCGAGRRQLPGRARRPRPPAIAGWSRRCRRPR